MEVKHIRVRRLIIGHDDARYSQENSYVDFKSGKNSTTENI